MCLTLLGVGNEVVRCSPTPGLPRLAGETTMHRQIPKEGQEG